MPIRHFIRLAFVSTLSASVFPSISNSTPTDFFPSVPIHEDDRIVGEVELRAVECLFEITIYTPSVFSPRRATKIKFDLSIYDTHARRVNAPGKSARLSTRHSIVWFANGVTDADLEHVNALLRDAEVTLIERLRNDKAAIEKKQFRLKELLTEIESGSFGVHAAQNHAVSFNVDGKDRKILSIWVNRAFHLPVERGQAEQLIFEMDKYRRDHCSEN